MKRIRPFPMKGNFFANCFIHFEPYEAIDGTSTYDPTKDIPPYLISGSVFEKEWKSAYPLGWKGNKETNIRVFVAEGNTVEFEAMIRKDIELMHEADANGWTVLHEAARSGQLGIIKLILKYGGDKNLFTKYGVSPLNIALEHLDSDHELIVYFESIGAKNVSPYRSKRRHREL